MELQEPITPFAPAKDLRPAMPEPPPVRLVAIEDVHAPAAAGLEKQLDAFYVDLLKFIREAPESESIVYKGENRRICFEVCEPPIVRQDLRPIGIEVPSLLLLERELIERKIDYQWQKGLAPGQETLLLQDPAGNWLRISLFARV